MFGFFKSKSQLEKLSEKYSELLAEAHKMSSIDRKESDRLTQEAEKVAMQIDELKKP